MSLQDYQDSKQISLQEPPFYAMVMAATYVAKPEDRAKLDKEWSRAWRRSYDVAHSQKLVEEFKGLSFESWIMAMLRKSDTENTEIILRQWPEIHAEMKARYNAPGGILRGETV